MGLVISRKAGESITITDKETGEKIVITASIRSKFQYKLDIQASRRFIIDRTEKMEKEE